MKLIYKGIEVRSEYYGGKNWNFQSNNTNYHKVFLRNLETRKHTNFEFWCSIKHPRIETEGDLYKALECFLRDALAGELSYETFCDEFGYDMFKEGGYPNANSKRAWNGCRVAREKFNRIFEGMDLREVYDDILELERREREK